MAAKQDFVDIHNFKFSATEGATFPFRVFFHAFSKQPVTQKVVEMFWGFCF